MLRINRLPLRQSRRALPREWILRLVRGIRLVIRGDFLGRPIREPHVPDRSVDVMLLVEPRAWIGRQSSL
ncbi:MAG: hypothetical protein R3B96_02470 [Pirellulaceae bacterium]